MRLKLEFSKPTEPISVNNQHLVNSYIHRLLGNNNKYHDVKSNYCVSPLCGGKLTPEKTLLFDKNPYIIVSSQDLEFLNTLMVGLMNEKIFCCGSEFLKSTIIQEEFYNGWNHFFTLSPVLLKQQNKGERVKFITINDKNYVDLLKQQIVNKLEKIDSNLDLSDFEIVIDDKGKKMRKVLVKNVINHASSFKISIKTNKIVAEKLYNLGLGQSTGSGFGCIYKTENYEMYKF